MRFNSKDWRHWFALSLLLHVVTAHFSLGYFHPDEHFSILEFVGYKLGLTPAADLPWEFAARNRPWFEPGLLYLIAVPLRALGLKKPFVLAELFRQLSGVCSWFATLAVFKYCRDSGFDDPKRTRLMAMLACCLWFMPFLHVRLASETFAASFFMLGFIAMLRERPLLAGVLMASAYEFRPQNPFMLLSFGAWLIFIRRERWSRFAICSLTMLAMLGVAVCVDRWGYGEWVFTPWEYFKVNVVQDKAALNWGTLPWWGYFYLIGRLVPPLTIALTVTTFVAWWKYPRHVLTWISVPFFVAHCFVRHKEARFIFQIAWLAPFFFVMAWEPLSPRLSRWMRTKTARALGGFLIVFNFGAMAYLSLLPARQEFLFFREIYERFPEGVELHHLGEEPFNLAQVKVHFFRPKNLVQTPTPTLEDFARKLDQVKQPLYLTHLGRTLANAQALGTHKCTIEYSTLPAWEEKYIPPSKLARIRTLTLERCE